MFFNSNYSLIVLLNFRKYRCVLSHYCCILCIFVLCFVAVMENFKKIVKILVIYKMRYAIVKICNYKSTSEDHTGLFNNNLGCYYLSCLFYIFYILAFFHRILNTFICDLLLSYNCITIPSILNSFRHLITYFSFCILECRCDVT